MYYRWELRRDRAGLLACPDEGDGRDMVTLGEGNALQASRPRYTAPPRDGGNIDNDGPTRGTAVYITEGDDIG